MNKYIKYEEEKHKLQELNLSSKEYQKALKELAKRLKI